MSLAHCQAIALLVQNFPKTKEGGWDQADYPENVFKQLPINLIRAASYTFCLSSQVPTLLLTLE